LIKPTIAAILRGLFEGAFAYAGNPATALFADH
jgi:hypothetical protein